MIHRVPSQLLPLAFVAVCGIAAADDGYFDPAWAGGGRIVFAGDFHNPGANSSALQVTLQGNGNLLLGGNVFTQGWWLGELLPGGIPVPTFGESNGSGVITGCHLSASLCNTTFGSFVLQDDDRIVVVGTFGSDLLVRTSAQAHALDTVGVVGGTGYVSMAVQINDVQGRFDNGWALAATPSGKWMVAGFGYYSAAAPGKGNSDFAAIRFNEDLSFDTTFNAVTDEYNVSFAGGKLVAFDRVANGADYAGAMIVQDDGRIVLAGYSAPGTYLSLARLNVDGSLDTTFGPNGTGKSVLAVVSGLSAQSMKADRAGRLLVASHNQSSGGMRVVRLTRDGIPDPSFGPDGLSLQVPAGTCAAGGVAANGLALDSAGRIVVVGTCQESNSSTFLVERLRGDNGTLDTSFGIDGWGYGAFSTTSISNEASDVAFDSSGRPIVVGSSQALSSGVLGVVKAGVARLTYDLIYTNNFETTPRGCLMPDCS